MKQFSSIILTSLLTLWSISSLAAGNQYKLEVNGLACPFCAYGIEKQLTHIEGVSNVKTDVAKGLVTVEMTKNYLLKKSQAKQAIKDAGFTLKGFTKEAGKQ